MELSKIFEISIKKYFLTDLVKYTYISVFNISHIETEDNFYAPACITMVDFDRNMVYGKIYGCKHSFMIKFR